MDQRNSPTEEGTFCVAFTPRTVLDRTDSLQIMDLKNRNASPQEVSLPPANGLGAKGFCSVHADWPPRPSPAHCFPPSYNTTAPATDDPTVKI
jgi:hypothetical protein